MRIELGFFLVLKRQITTKNYEIKCKYQEEILYIYQLKYLQYHSSNQCYKNAI